MTTTIEYLDALKASTGAPSDYKLAQILGLTKQMISEYRNGKSFLSDEICLRVAQILDLEPYEVLLNAHAERATNQVIKKSYLDILSRVSGIAASFLIASTLLASPTAARAGLCASSYNNVYYVKSKRRISTRLKQLFLFYWHGYCLSAPQQAILYN